MRILTNSILYTFGSFLPILSGFILIPLYTRLLGLTEYSILQLVSPIQGILVIILTLGLERSLPRFYFDSSNGAYRTKLLSTVSVAIFFSSTLLVLLVMVSENLLENMFSQIQFDPYVKLTVIWSYLYIFSLLPRTYYRLEEQAAKYILFSSCHFVIQFLVIYFIGIKYYMTAEGVIISNVISALILLLISLWILRDKLIWIFDKKLFQSTILFSLPLLPAAFAGWALNLSDRMFLDRFATLNEIGYYSLAFQMSQIITLVGSGILAAYGPYYFRTANSHLSKDAINNKLSFGNKVFTYLVLLTTVTLLTFAPELLLLLASDDYLPTLEVLPYIVVGAFFSQLHGLINLSMYQKKKTVIISIIILISAGLNFFLNMILIPRYGIVGAGIATLISFLVYFVLGMIYSSKGFLVTTPLLPICFFCVYVVFQQLFLQDVHIMLKIFIVLLLGIGMLLDVKSKYPFNHYLP